MNIIGGDAISYPTVILISVVSSLLYVPIGGAGGVVLLDAVWAVILLVGIAVAVWTTIAPVGDIQALFTQIISKMLELLSKPGSQGTHTDKYWIMQSIVLSFGIWFYLHIRVKSLMAKDEDALAKLAISIPLSWILIYGSAALFIGLAGHLLLQPQQVGTANNVLPLLMTTRSKWFIVALVMVAAVAAGISTISAMLLVFSQIVPQGLILINRKGGISERKNTILSRTIIFIIAAVCGIMAPSPSETLVQIVQNITYTGSAQLVPAFLSGIYWGGCIKTGAACDMSAGIAILFGTGTMSIAPLGWPGFMWGFFTNILLMVLASLVTRQRKPCVG